MNPGMSAYEVLDLVSNASAQFDAIFSYWISVTFAVVAGTFIAREQINLGLALTIASVYAAAALMFAVRFYSNIQLMSGVLDSPVLPEGFESSLEILVPARVGTFLLGFVVTECFVAYTYLRAERT